MSRGPHRLAVVTYADIADWTGLSLQTVRGYASEGQFDQHDLGSILEWVNRRRADAGLPLIGMPAEDSEKILLDTRDCGNKSANPYIRRLKSSGYNPLTGEYDV